jgi:hypothetical protein
MKFLLAGTRTKKIICDWSNRAPRSNLGLAVPSGYYNGINLHAHTRAKFVTVSGAGPTSGAPIFVRFWGVADISRRPARIAFAAVDP